jgi:hypothetical protein
LEARTGLECEISLISGKLTQSCGSMENALVRELYVGRTKQENKYRNPIA